MSVKSQATAHEARLVKECMRACAALGYDVKFIAAPDMLEAWCCDSSTPMELRCRTAQHIYRHTNWRDLTQLVTEKLAMVHAESWLEANSRSRRRSTTRSSTSEAEGA